MKVLIFALLALAVSVESYGYGKSYYSSYPSYGGYGGYGGGYGGYGGYGSSLYGSSYGLGGAGYYSGGGLGGYNTAYTPSIYKTARYSYNYPQGNAAAYQGGTHGYLTAERPGKITFTQDFSGIAGLSGEHRGTPERLTHDKRTFVIPQSAGASDGSSTRQFTGDQGPVTVDEFAGIKLAEEVAGIGAKGFVGTDVTGTKINRASVPAAAKIPSGSSHVSGAGRKSGTHGFGTAGGHSKVSFTQDFSKVTGQTGVPARKTDIKISDKLTIPINDQRAPSENFSDKSEGQEIKDATGHGQESFAKDFSKSTEQSHQIQVQPEIHEFDQISAPVSGTTESGFSGVTDAEQSHKTRTQEGEIISAQDIAGVAGLSGHRASGQSGHQVAGGKSSVASLDKLTTGGIAGTQKHFTGSTHRSGSQGFSTGVGPQISFVKGEVPRLRPDSVKTATAVVVPERGETIFAQDIGAISGHQVAGLRPVVPSFDTFSTGGIQKPSTGYVHRAGSTHKTGSQGFSTVGAGPQISFVRGGTTLQHQGPRQAAPAVIKPFPGAVGSLSKNRGHGFSTASGPSRISFTQDFSGIFSQQSQGFRPEISTFDNIEIPVFPGSTFSQSFTGHRNKATFVSPINVQPVQSIVPVHLDVKAPKKPVAQQPTYTAFHDISSPYGLFYGPEVGEKTIFEAGPASGFADGYSVDYKHDSIASVEGKTGDKYQSGFVIVPETSFALDKPTAMRYSSVAVDAAGGPDSSAGSSGHSDDALSYNVDPRIQTGDRPNLYVAVPAEGDDDVKSAIFLHSSDGVAPSGTFVEEKGSFFQVSPKGGHSSAVPSYDIHEPQLPVL